MWENSGRSLGRNELVLAERLVQDSGDSDTNKCFELLVKQMRVWLIHLQLELKSAPVGWKFHKLLFGSSASVR